MGCGPCPSLLNAALIASSFDTIRRQRGRAWRALPAHRNGRSASAPRAGRSAASSLSARFPPRVSPASLHWGRTRPPKPGRAPDSQGPPGGARDRGVQLPRPQPPPGLPGRLPPLTGSPARKPASGPCWPQTPSTSASLSGGRRSPRCSRTCRRRCVRPRAAEWLRLCPAHTEFPPRPPARLPQTAPRFPRVTGSQLGTHAEPGLWEATPLHLLGGGHPSFLRICAREAVSVAGVTLKAPGGHGISAIALLSAQPRHRGKAPCGCLRRGAWPPRSPG